MTDHPAPPSPHGDAEQAWAEFVKFLKRKDARITKSRRIVLEHVLTRRDHFRADEVASALATGPNRVSRGTVYRTLALLVEMGVLREIRDSDTHVHYETEWGNEHHEHMICDACGAFIEFQDQVMAEILMRACQEKGFRQRAHRIIVMGTCADCQGRPPRS